MHTLGHHFPSVNMTIIKEGFFWQYPSIVVMLLSHMGSSSDFYNSKLVLNIVVVLFMIMLS